MGFELFFGFLGVPEHDQKTLFFLEWLWALSGGLGTQFDASGDPKNRSREDYFGYLCRVLGDPFLNRFFTFCLFVSIVPTLRSYRYLHCLSTLPFFETVEKCEKKRIENT